jgi:hypothetical protein
MPAYSYNFYNLPAKSHGVLVKAKRPIRAVSSNWVLTYCHFVDTNKKQFFMSHEVHEDEKNHIFLRVLRALRGENLSFSNALSLNE